MSKEKAVTYKKDHNYYVEYQHEVAKNDKLSNLLQKLDRENERLSDELEALKERKKTKEIELSFIDKLLKFLKKDKYAYRINKKIKKLKSKGLLRTKDISDTYHTIGELYDYRMAYNFALCKSINLLKREDVYCYKSLKHHDGTMFDGMFIVVIESPFGQISNHYNMSCYEMLDIPVKEYALEYDGHTPGQALNRILLLFSGEAKNE